MRYGESKSGYIYNESLLNLNLMIDDLAVWTQFEYSNPPEFGRSIRGLRKFRLEYTRDSQYLKIGDFYEIWGRGLMLYQYDDQAIDFDNAITGISYRNSASDLINWGLLAGNGSVWYNEFGYHNPPFSDRVPNYQRRHRVIGADGELSLSNLIVGTSFLQAREKHPVETFADGEWATDTTNLVHRLHGLRLESFTRWFDLYIEYAEKETRLADDRGRLAGRGQGFYGNLNCFFGPVGLSTEYKKYSFDVGPPAEYSLVTDISGVVGYQRPPTAMREHSSRLLGRISRAVNFNDEVGYQVELTSPLGQSHNFAANYSAASRNHKWNQESSLWQRSGEGALLPLKAVSAQPFSETYFELDGFLMNDRLHYKIGYGKSDYITEVFSYSKIDSIRNINYKSLAAQTIPLAADIKIADRINLEAKYEYQVLQKRQHVVFSMTGLDTAYSRFPKSYQYNAFASLGISYSPHFSIALLIDASSVLEYGTTAPSGHINYLEKFVRQYIDIENRWIALETRWNITASNILTITYGSQQGGVLCSNGVCREIAAFEDGFKFTLTTIF